MGADWGFATDPSTLIRCHIIDRNLYIDHEAWGFGVELDALPAMFETVPGSKRWTIYADSARPETISYMQRHGYPNIKSVKKWPGSVEDGIEYIKSFDRIIIHPRCKNIILEMELYQYKQDRITGEVIPTLEDKHNHGIDSLRYSLADYIRSKGASVPSFNLRAVAGI
jgi:phage terminase large subunit